MKKLLLILAALFTTPAMATPTITVPTSVTVVESVGRVTFTLKKDAAATDYSEVWVSTSDVGQTAKAGVDFIATSHDVEFDNGDLARTFTIRIINHTGVQGTRSFVINFRSQRYATLSATQMVVTITDTAPLTAGGFAKVIATEQAVPKESPFMYGEGVYRTVLAGEVVKLGASFPDAGCTCTGQRREWQVFGPDGKFIGYVWEANLSVAA